MDPALVVSPHADDAVFSVGQFLAGRPDTHVVTVFTGCPGDDRLLTTYDRDCGFPSAGVAQRVRDAEDRKALGVVKATGQHLGFLDHQYRDVVGDEAPLDGESLEERIQVELENVALLLMEAVPAPLVMVGPLGLKHPDHHITSRAVELAARSLGPDRCELWLYEDMPSRVIWPDEVPDRLAWWRGMGWDPELAFLGTGPLRRKAQAVGAYGSQLGFPEFEGRHTVLVPERTYRMWPSCS